MGRSVGGSAGGGTVTVRYWAAARAAAGVAAEVIPVDGSASLAELLDVVRTGHAERPKLAEVIAVCSVLVGDAPVGSRDPAAVRVREGDVVELLPPFAGG